MRFLPGILLAVLVCAAIDTTLTRAAHGHRTEEWLLPAQALAGWAVFALVVAWPANWTARRLRAGFAASVGWLVGPIAVHHALAAHLDGARRLSLRDDWSSVALALVGVLAGTWVLWWTERRMQRRRVGWLVLFAAVLLLVPQGSWGLTPAPGSPVVHTGDDRPNLLLLVWDTTRADRLSPWGYERTTTPNLARLAGQSTLFDTCWSASVFTLSSHTSMLTGLPVSLHGTTLRHQVVAAPTVVHDLAAAGYRTGAVVGTSVLAAGYGIERGFDVYNDLVDPPLCDTHLWSMVNDAQVIIASQVPALRFNGQPHWFQDFQRPADEVLARALDFVQADDGRPWFLMVNLFDAHWPYVPDAEAARRWVRPYGGPLDGYLFRADDYPPGRDPDASDRAHVSDLYDAELWQLDRQVDGFLAELDLARGDTSVLMTSDHGEGLGENDQWSHDHLQAPQTRVPLLLHAPGRAEAGKRVTAPTSGIDVGPTLLDLAGVERPPERGMAGRSLLASDLEADRLLFVQDHDNVYADRDGDAVINRRFKLLSTDGKTTLHDLSSDPMDRQDLSARFPGIVAELTAALTALQAVAAETEDGLFNADALRGLGYFGN